MTKKSIKNPLKTLRVSLVLVSLENLKKFPWKFTKTQDPSKKLKIDQMINQLLFKHYLIFSVSDLKYR